MHFNDIDLFRFKLPLLSPRKTTILLIHKLPTFTDSSTLSISFDLSTRPSLLYGTRLEPIVRRLTSPLFRNNSQTPFPHTSTLQRTKQQT